MHPELHNSEMFHFYFVGLALYSHVFDEGANCGRTRFDHCNEKNNLFLFNKGDKWFSPHKAEPDCQINQHLNANMAFGSAVFMAGLHHRINSVGYKLTPMIFLYLWEPAKQKFLEAVFIFLQNITLPSPPDLVNNLSQNVFPIFICRFSYMFHFAKLVTSKCGLKFKVVECSTCTQR